jgi:hypothetical protein
MTYPIRRGELIHLITVIVLDSPSRTPTFQVEVGVLYLLSIVGALTEQTQDSDVHYTFGSRFLPAQVDQNSKSVIAARLAHLLLFSQGSRDS